MSYGIKAAVLEKAGTYDAMFVKIGGEEEELKHLESIGYYCKYEDGLIVLKDTLVTEMGGDLPGLAKEFLAYKDGGYEDIGMKFQDYASDDISEEEEKGIREAYDYFTDK